MCTNITSFISKRSLRSNEMDINQVISQLNELEKQMEPDFWRVGKTSSLVLTEEQKNTILEMISQWKEAPPITS